MKQYDYIIVGSGLFGATFNYLAKAAGKTCLIVERRNHIGGNLYSPIVDGIPIHQYGAHIFHTHDKSIWDFVCNNCEMVPFINSPIARYKNEIYNLPFNMNTFSKLFNVFTPDEAKSAIEKEIADANISEPKNLEEQAISLVGRTIYEKLIKGYTEKQWNRECKDLPAFIIKRLPVRFVYDNNYFNDPYQGIPKGGYTGLVEKLLDGITVKLNTSYEDYCRKNEQTGLFESVDGEHTFEKILYTGMIDEFYHYQLGELSYRSLRFETEVLEGEENYQGNAVVNYTEREVPYTRIIEHKHFEFGKQPDTVITREYPQDWEKGQDPYYPVNDDKNSMLYEAYAELAKKEKNVLFGGRLGQYKYYDMDKVIRAALNMVKEEMN